jgi:hypothetical protein
MYGPLRWRPPSFRDSSQRDEREIFSKNNEYKTQSAQGEPQSSLRKRMAAVNIGLKYKA